MSFKMDKTDVKTISKIFQSNIIKIPTHEIKVSLDGEWNHKVYQTLEDVSNNLGFTPSPLVHYQKI